MPPAKQPSDLKNRVITCLNKLSDRDTLTMATNELDSIAKSLTNDAFAPFLTCLSTTDSAEKSPVRRQCVRLLSVMSVAHGDALSPHLSKMLASVLRRLRDPDSSVRSACVDAVSSISSHITRPPFSAILKPLADCISHEQDYNAQIGASLCLAAGIEASPEPEAYELKKLLPRLLKLVRNDCFKAKPALLSLIGSIASVGGASGKNLLNSLVPSMVEFLSSDDWAARKAAAEALGRLALAESNFLSEFKCTSLASLESRRFDKVKVVRETMNRAIELWKLVPGVSDEVSDETESKSSSSRDLACDDIGSVTPQVKKTIFKVRSLPSDNSFMSNNLKKSPPKCDFGKPKASKPSQMDSRRPSDANTGVAVLQSPSLEMACKEQKGPERGVLDSLDSRSSASSRSEAKRTVFQRNSDEKSHRFGGLRFGARVVPLIENGDCEPNAMDSSATNMIGSQQEFENLSLIQKQLHQIENQQSSLLDLLQRFIGHSQNGMNSLERRVNGLEKVLDEMSQDLAVSTRRVSSAEAGGNTCCMLPGAEFLSPKFWRKTEGQSSSSFRSNYQSLNCTPVKDVISEASKPESPISRHQTGSMSSLDTSESALTYSNRTTGSYTSIKRMNKMIQDAEALKGGYSGGVGRPSQATCIQQQS